MTPEQQPYTTHVRFGTDVKIITLADSCTERSLMTFRQLLASDARVADQKWHHATIDPARKQMRIVGEDVEIVVPNAQAGYGTASVNLAAMLAAIGSNTYGAYYKNLVESSWNSSLTFYIVSASTHL